MNRFFGALLLMLALSGLTACTLQSSMEDAVLVEPAPVEPAPVEPVVENRKTDCMSPGTDDGIGGTGCKVPAID